MTLYLGESSGARILTYGVGLSQIGDDYQPSFQTWDIVPAQEMGDVVFRSLGLSFSYTNGYNIGITPVIDGIAQAESTFTGAGSGTDGQAQVYCKYRGTRISAIVRCVSRNGSITFYNMQVSSAPIRQWP